MRRLFIILFAIILIANCQFYSAFEDYRNNPFQYPYPEYYLKANVINLQKSRAGTVPVVIDTGVHRISIGINAGMAVSVKKKHDSFYLLTNNKLFGVVTIEKENYMGCSGETKEYEKDFCSAFNSSKEYFMKLFTLTPDNLKEQKYAAVGNKWIVHNKGSWFKDVNNVFVYETGQFTAFRRDFKTSATGKTKTELTLFHTMLSPDYLGIALTISDEKIIESILSTLEITQ